MNAETRWNIDAKTMIAAPFAINPTRLTDEARERWDSDVLQSIIAERMANDAAKERRKTLVLSHRESHNSRQRNDAVLVSNAKIMAVLTDEWQSRRAITDASGMPDGTTWTILDRLLKSGEAECSKVVGCNSFFYRRAQA